MQIDIHALSGISTRDPSIRAGEDSSILGNTEDDPFQMSQKETKTLQKGIHFITS
jgi:hypothetical protein